MGTSLVFGAAHIAGSVIAGIDIATIGFQVAALAMTGSLYYWVRRVTGGIWVGVLIHALIDFVLYISTGNGTPTEGLNASNEVTADNAPTVAVQILLIALSIAGLISAAHEDRRARRARAAAHAPA